MIEKTIQVMTVKPGPFGGGAVKGAIIGERAEIWCVVEWKVDINLPKPGEFWHMVGSLYWDTEWKQEQLRVSECYPEKLPSEKYLTTLLIKHPAFTGFSFGKVRVNNLVAMYGEAQLVQYLNDGNIEALAEAKKMNVSIAKEVVKAWRSLNNEVDTVNFLLEHKFSPELARKVIYLCRHNAVERLKNNPYTLVCFGGITKSIWRTVEVCAKKMGVPLDHKHRLVGAVEHALYEHLRLGHTAMPLSELLAAAEKHSRTRKRAEEGVRMALRRNVVCSINHYPEPLIQLYGPAIIELQLERRIESLLTGPTQLDMDSDDIPLLKMLIDDYCVREAKGGINFSATQKEAVFMALTSRCSVLTGFGGTGKTTVLKAVIDIAKLTRRKSHLQALAGKARERAHLATGHRAFTIHAFIAAVKKGAEESDIALNGDPLIIVDEASMVDAALFNELLSMMDNKQYSLLLVGDPAQLSPVGFGLVFHRLVKISDVPVTHLTEAYCQQSVLHDIAMAVRDYNEDSIAIDIPEWEGETEGVYFVPTDKNCLWGKLLSLKLLEAENKLPTAQILTPHMAPNKPDAGQKISNFVQRQLTSRNEGIRLGTNWLRVDDPVIVNETSYELGLFNGATGRLLKVDTGDNVLTGLFEFEGHDEKISLTKDDLYSLNMKPAYAITIHKSQGIEYEAAIITCVVNSPMIERSLIYTALTRAKKLCLIVGSVDVFHKAVAKPPRADTLCCGFFLSKLHPQIRKAS